MLIDYAQRQDWLDRFREILPIEISLERGKIITTLSDEGDFLGAVFYSNFTPWTCEMSMAGVDGWLSRKAIREFFYYPFVQCKLARVSAYVRRGNERALDIDLRLGFQIEGLRRNWYGDEDAFALGMLREECKWLS